MRKFINLIAFAALLFAPALATAQAELTVADGGANNAYIPVYGYYTDAPQHNQVLYPADSLEELTGGTISGLTFYLQSQADGEWNITVTLSLGTTDATSLTDLDNTTALTQVWEGTMNANMSEIVIEFDEPFPYEGNNLLLDIQTTEGSYKSANFAGVNLDGASYYSYTYYGYTSGAVTNFLPKTTFSYIPGGGDFCYKPKNIAFSDRTNEGFTVSWTQPYGGGTQYAIFVDGEYLTTVTDTFYTVSGLEANTQYSVQVKNVCGDEDSSSALTGSFRTDCQDDSCELTISATGSYYNPSVLVYQNSTLLATVSGQQNVEICSGDSVVLTYQAPSYSSGSNNIVVTDVAETELYSGNASGLSTGDTLTTIANGCPSCMPVSNLHVSDADTDFFTVSWVGPTNAQGYIVYLDSVEATDYDGTSTEYTVSGLTSSDNHLIQVRVDCGDEDSSAWRSIHGAATCTRSHISADDEAEFYETLVGLDGTFGGSVSASADHTAGNALLPCWYFSNNFVWLKNQEITFEGSHPESYLCLPVMDAPINTLEITWTGKIGNTGDTPDSVVIGVADFTGEIVEWIDTLYYVNQSRAAWVDHPWYRFEQYEGDGVRFAFKVLFSSNWNAFKNFHVRQIPQCTAPTNLVGHNYTDADSTYFTWTPQGSAEEWEVVIGEPTDDPDMLSSITVAEPTYVIPAGTITMGQQYRFWVRANCQDAQSEWLGHTFYSGTAIMPASGNTDTVSGCGLVIYDNGYQNVYSGTSTIVVRPAQAGQLVGISGGWFRNYTYQTDHQGTLTIYDGEGTNGTVLYQKDVYDTITDTILGEEGAITIRLQAGTYVGDGFELFTFCTDAPTCIRPKHLAVNTDEGITLSWDNSNATDYIIYYKVDTAEAEWQTINATDLTPDTTTYTFEAGVLEPATNYVVKVAGDCGGGDISLQSTERRFRTPCEGESCQVSVSFSSSYYTTDYELIQNGFGFGQSSSAHTYDVCSGMPLTLHTTAYSYGDGYEIILTNIADIELYRGSITTAVDTVLGNPCPSCLPAFDIVVDSADITSATISWSAMGDNTEWVVYLDGVEAGAASTTSYTFTDLTANTVYTVGVRANCGEDSSVLRTATMRTACENGNCTFTVEMADSFGDGWNGNSIEVYQNGALFQTLTITSGNNNIETVSTCLGDSVMLFWTTGSYATEASFTIKDAADSVLLTSGSMGSHVTGDTIMYFDGQCNATVVMSQGSTPGPGPQPGTCGTPTNLSATATETTATITFSGYADSYEVEIVAGSWQGSMGNAEPISTTSHTFTDLQPGTAYSIAVRSVCVDDYDGDTTYSDWATTAVTTQTVVVEGCDVPTDLEVVDGTVDTTSVVLHWTDHSSANRWQIKLTSSTGTDTLTVTGTTYSLNSLTPGKTYYAQVRALCSDTLFSGWSETITFQTASHGTGIDAIDAIGVRLFPNPASSVVTIEVAEPAEVSMVDISGRTVGSWTTDGSALKVALGQMAKGTYFVRVVSEGGIAVRKLVVK